METQIPNLTPSGDNLDASTSANENGNDSKFFSSTLPLRNNSEPASVDVLSSHFSFIDEMWRITPYRERPQMLRITNSSEGLDLYEFMLIWRELSERINSRNDSNRKGPKQDPLVAFSMQTALTHLKTRGLCPDSYEIRESASAIHYTPSARYSLAKGKVQLPSGAALDFSSSLLCGRLTLSDPEQWLTLILGLSTCRPIDPKSWVVIGVPSYRAYVRGLYVEQCSFAQPGVDLAHLAYKLNQPGFVHKAPLNRSGYYAMLQKELRGILIQQPKMVTIFPLPMTSDMHNVPSTSSI